jgi:hypothetical protein
LAIGSVTVVTSPTASTSVHTGDVVSRHTTS